MAKERRKIDYTNIERMHFIPTKDKDLNWMQDMMRVMERNSKPFVDPTTMAQRRSFEKGIRDAEKAKKIIDPPTDKSKGGNPKNFASNFHANHIHTNINRIVDAKLSKGAKDIKIKCIDGYALSKKMKDNRRILDRKNMIMAINHYNKQIGDPLIDENTDPYKYIQEEEAKLANESMADGGGGGQQQEGEPQQKQNPKKKDESGRQSTSILDYIKQMIEDSEGLALYNEYVYKDDIAVPCELGIKYYSEQNNLATIENKFHKDLRHASAVAMRFYTSEVDGDPVLQYVEPELLRTNPMKDNDYDCKGLEFVYYDMEMYFGEFMKTIGAKLDDKQLLDVFNANRRFAGARQVDNFGIVSRGDLEYTVIRLRYAEILTQNVDVYSEGKVNGNYSLRPAKFEFKNKANSKYKRVEKNYNVWYYCYSLPYSIGDAIGTSASNFMIDGGLLQDQQREGDNKRFSKSSFILYRRSDMVSFTDIEMEYMEELNPLWDKIKNDVRQALPHGTLFNWDAMQTMIEALDSGDKPQEAFGKLIRDIKQTGSGALPEFSIKGEKFSWLTQDVRTGHISSALEKLQMFNVVYQQMKQALGINDATEGIEPQARQALGGVEIATEASNNSRYYLEEIKENILEELGYRFVVHFSNVVKKGGKRFRQFADVIGYANELEIQTIKDIPLHRIGLYVDYTDDAELRGMVNSIILEQSKTGNIKTSVALFIIGIENVKYKYALLRLEEKKQERQAQQAQMSQQQAQEDMMKKQMEMEAYATKMRVDEYREKKKIDFEFEVLMGKEKTKNQKDIKAGTTKGRKEEATHKAKIDLNKEKAVKESEIMGGEPPIDSLETPIGEEGFPQEQQGIPQEGQVEQQEGQQIPLQEIQQNE